jgi:hypothetical protein
VTRPGALPSSGRRGRLSLVVAALLLGAACAAKMLAEFDLPWHLAFGRAVAETWSIPRVDDFAYTHTAIRYVGVVGDLLLFAIVRVAGPLGLQIANGLVAIAIASTLLLDVSIRTPGVNPLSLGVIAGAIVGVSRWLFVRPATIAFLFVPVTLLFVSVHRAAPTTRRGERALVAAAALALVWCNIHGSVILGVVLLAVYAAYRAACTTAGGRVPTMLPAADAGSVRLAVACAMAAAVLACINPAGTAIFHGVQTVGSYSDLLGEWHATGWHFFTAESPPAGAFLVVAAILTAVGRSPSGARGFALFDASLVVGALLLAMRIRFVPIAIVVLAPVAAVRVAGFVRDSTTMRAAFATVACMVGPAVAILDKGTLGVGFDPRSFPEPAVRFIAEEKPRGNMWNFWPFGGYLIWRLYPEQRVLLDGRIGFVHERQLVQRAVASEVDPRAFAELAAELHFEWAVCRADERGPWCAPVARSPEWRMVFDDPLSAIYVRIAGPNAHLAEGGYRVLTHLTPPEAVFDLALRGARADDLAHDAMLLRRQGPESSRAWFVDACAALALGDRARFEAARARLALLMPEHPSLALLAEGARARLGEPATKEGGSR